LVLRLNNIPLVERSNKGYQAAGKDILSKDQHTRESDPRPCQLQNSSIGYMNLPTYFGRRRRARDTNTPTRELPIVDWLLIHGNYVMWKGHNNGVSKREFKKKFLTFSIRKVQI
jgi:hypothetical protein